MNKLTRPQLTQLEQALYRSGPHQALQVELIDHLASEIEHLITTGQPFETALHQVMQEANPQAVAQLKQTYQQLVNPVPALAFSKRLTSGRQRKRQLVSNQFPTWLRVSVVAFVTLMICLTWVSQLFDLPLGIFGGVWLLGLASLIGSLSARLLFRPRPRRGRYRWA